MMLRFERLPLPETDEDKARWWEAERDLLLAGVRGREIIPDRPPDRIQTESSLAPSVSERVERRHSLFTTWPVKVVTYRYPVFVNLRWRGVPMPDGSETEVGVRIWHHDEISRGEEDMA